MQLTLEIGSQYVMVQVYCAAGGSPGSYQQYSILNVLLAGVPYQPTGYEGTGPGAQIQLSETADSTGLTATIAAPNQHYTKSFTVPGSWAGSAFVGTLDYLESAQGGVPAYNPVGFASTTLNGSSLGSYLSGTPAPNSADQNSVFGATLQDQSSDLGSSDSFSITNANTTLPTVLVSTAKPGVERPSSGKATITFTVALSFPSSSPVYLDYATQDDTAFAGSDYTGTSGTLGFAPGATSQTVSVKVLPGPESGGELDFLLAISNPSFAYNPPGSAGVGRIYAGPMVLDVAPDLVRLGGGGSVTLTGVFFGPPGSADTVSLCASGCAAATSLRVESDTSIKLTVPNLSGIDPSGSSPFTADAVVTDTHSVSSPIASSDEVHVGCQEVSDQPVGAWSYSGCVNKIDSDDAVTNQTSLLDGMDVSASKHNEVDYSTGGAAGAAVGSSATSTISVNVAGKLVPVFQGVVSKGLSGTTTLTPPAGSQIEGMTLAGPVTFTPNGPTSANASVAVQLPSWLGGDTATMTFATSAADGVSNLQLTAAQASFGDLLSLSNVLMTWTPSLGWQLSGNATAGGGIDGSAITASFKFVNNVLTAGHLNATNLDVLGLFSVTSLDLTYASGTWSGQAPLTPVDGVATANVSLTIDGTGHVTTGSVTVGQPIDLFGGFPVSAFAMSYASGAWNVSGQAPVGGGLGALLTGKLSVANGEIQSAQIKLKKFPITDVLKIQTASLKYSLVNGQKTYTGELAVKIPLQNGLLEGIGGSVTIIDGQIKGLGIQLLTNSPVPLIDGLFITKLGASIAWSPPPAQLVGATASIGLGPQINGLGQIMSVDGTFTRNQQPIPLVSNYTFVGAVNVLGTPVGAATVTLPDSGEPNIALTIGGDSGVLSIGPLTLTGSLSGPFSNGKFNLDGGGTVTFTGQAPFTATIHADQKGMAACDGKKRGFSLIWGQLPQRQTDGECSTKGF